MKVALIKCSGSLNVGNEFINAGGVYIAHQIFPNAEFLEYEFFDSAIPQNYKYPTPALLDWTKQQIEENCDYMLVFCGCIISKFTEAVLNELAKIRIKKILLGAGSYQYDNYDQSLSLKLVKKFDYIFTRDDISFSYFGGAKNVFSGLDLAFFVKDFLNNPPLIGNYALINLDPLEKNIEEIKKYKKMLLFRFRHTYIIENTTTKHGNIKDYLYIGYWDNLYKTISHAKYVITNRIHTSVCCISNSVPFMYLGYDNSEIIGRSSLFSKIDFKLIHGYQYKYKELNDMQHIINDKKIEFLTLINSIIK